MDMEVPQYRTVVDPDESDISTTEELISEDELDEDELRLAHDSDMALFVYHNVWTAFYTWEWEECERLLSNLMYDRQTMIPDPLPPILTRTFGPSTPDSLYGDSFIIQDFDHETSTLHTTTVLSREPFTVPGELAPHPRYTSCTPASQNVRASSDAHLVADFAPFADDTKFKLKQYLKEFNQFKWQTDAVDPDVETIQLETVRRLYYNQNIPLDAMDNLKIFNIPVHDSGRSGLLWYCYQRDQLLWPGAPKWTNLDGHVRAAEEESNDQLLPTTFINMEIDLHGNVRNDSETFCPQLNCIKPCCGLHERFNQIKDIKPNKKNKDFRKNKKKICGDECFRVVELENMNMSNNHWDEEDHSLFSSAFLLAPDTLPCDMSVICRKPCFEMYIERLQVLDDDSEHLFSQKEEKEKGQVDKVFDEDNQEIDDQSKHPAPVGPCYHLGSCLHARPACPCYSNNQRCGRNCHCSKRCKIRWKGCKCSSSGRTCGVDTNCPCRRISRECDPELCLKCNAQSAKEKKCQNVNAQKGRFADVQIKPAEWGLGAFAVFNIREGEYVGEYIGELYGGLEDSHMSELQKHSGLNYSFSHHATTASLDSWFIGNVTRYLNHSSSPNCDASTRLVNGDQRILITANDDIPAGHELFLDYGQPYWSQKGDTEAADEVDKTQEMKVPQGAAVHDSEAETESQDDEGENRRDDYRQGIEEDVEMDELMED